MRKFFLQQRMYNKKPENRLKKFFAETRRFSSFKPPPTIKQYRRRSVETRLNRKKHEDYGSNLNWK